MRLALLFGLALIATSGHPALAQRACTVAGSPYASGASLCQPAVREGRIEQMLFTCEDGAYTISDLGSSNGTYLLRDDFEKVDSAELNDGDEFALGNARFVFRLEAEAAPVEVDSDETFEEESTE